MVGPDPPQINEGEIKTCTKCGKSFFVGTYSGHKQSPVHIQSLKAGTRAAYAWAKKRAKAAVPKVRKPDPQTIDAPDRDVATLSDVQARLDEHEKGVLYLLCKQGRYANSVELAADYYETSAEVQEGRVLEWNLIELLLEDLNKAGYVVYRLAPTPLGEVMVRIKPTEKAYERVGEEFHFVRITNFGQWHRAAERPRDTRDATDFRNHGERATFVGEIVREDFIDHCAGCDHIVVHRIQLVELYGSDQL
jgi:hypothetical protein